MMSTEVIGPHRAELVDLGATLKCRLCGKTVIRFLDRTTEGARNGRQARR